MWAAHELRAPLHAAKAALEQAVVGGDGQGSVQPERLARIRDELGSLLEIIDPLIRCGSGEVTREAGPVDLGALARRVARAEGAAVMSDPRRVGVSGFRRAWVHGNEPLLRVALGNLVRNALVNTAPSERVSLVVEIEGVTVSVSVRDEGAGVPPEVRDRIFEAGWSGPPAWRPHGMGLGLVIARRIAEEHGGQVRLADSASGADFRMELPAAGSVC